MASNSLLLCFAFVAVFGLFVQHTLAQRKGCTYNGVIYLPKQEVLQGKQCCTCRPSGNFVCSPDTICFQEPGCASFVSDGCCPKCECKNSAGQVFKKNERWTNTVHGVCYECSCKGKNVAKCKATKPCKTQCAADELSDSKKCCSCGKPIPPTKAPPKKFKHKQEFEKYLESLG